MALRDGLEIELIFWCFSNWRWNIFRDFDVRRVVYGKILEMFFFLIRVILDEIFCKFKE